MPEPVDDAERVVAVTDVVDDDAQREQVVDLLEALVLGGVLLGFLRDRVDVLRAALDVGLDAARRKLVAQNLLDLGDVALADRPLRLDQSRDLLVALGLQVPERKVLQLPLELPDAEAVG